MRKSGLYLTVILGMTLAFGTCAEVRAQVTNLIKTCDFGATGDSCTFDLKATANGTLKVDMRSNTANTFWRAVVVEALQTAGIKTGIAWSTTSFHGAVQRSVAKDKFYKVIVIYELPPHLKIFPSSVQVRFNGPVTVSDPRPTSGGPVEEIASCTQLGEGAITAQAVDVEPITCGKLITCSLNPNPSGDTDRFEFTVPADGGAVSIKVAELNNFSGGWTFWTLHDPNGQPIASSYGQSESGFLGAGDHRIIVSNANNVTGDYVLTMHVISDSSWRCGTSMDYGGLKTGRLDKEGDIDAFHFSALKDQVVSIKVAEVNNFATGWTFWQLFDPNGQSIGFSYGEAQAGPFLSAGVHTIKVSNYVNAIGDYTLSLQKVGGP